MPRLSLRAGLLVALWATLVAPFVLRGLLGRSQPVGDAASSGDTSTLELRIITPHNQDIRRVFEPAFSAWHRQRFGAPVSIRYLSPGGTNDIVRYLKDLYGSYSDSKGRLLPEGDVRSGLDLVWGGGDYAFEKEFKPFLKPLALEPGVLEAAFPKRDLAGVPLLDPEASDGSPRWVGVVLSSFGIVYAPELYEVIGLPAPQHWTDLSRPELSGLLALADPTRSGSVALIYMMVIQRAMYEAERGFMRGHDSVESEPTAAVLADPRYQMALASGWKAGMRTLLLMAANASEFTDSGSRPCADVGDGQSAAGVAIDFYARVYQEQIGPRRITYVAPRGETAITPDPIGVLYGTLGDREILANRFVQFLLSREGQVLWNLKAGESPYVARSLRRMPARRDAYDNRTGWADDDDPFRAAAGFNMRQRWTRQLGRLRPIWAAAWIDAGPTLKRVYKALLGLPAGQGRARWLFELSDLPIEMAEVQSQPNATASPVGLDPRLVAARDRVQWARRFRAHYDAVLERASEAGQ